MRPLDFRGRSLGGLGLVHPVVKAKALLLKSMYREFKNKKCNINDINSFKDIYGYTGEFTEIVRAGITPNISSVIYSFLNEDMISKNNSIIPSRSEKRINGIKWRVAWQNLR